MAHLARRSHAAALAVAAVYLAPILYTVSRAGHDAVYNFFAADAYYYFTVAKNTPIGSLATFDGVSPTNGFHPLWQYVLVALARIANHDKETFISLIFALDCAIASAGVYLLARTVYEEHRRAWLALFLVPGLFHVLAPQSGLYAISAWRLANGMETALSLLFLAAFVRKLATLVRERATAWSDADLFALGCIAALLVWARLDNFAITAVLPLLLARGERTWRSAACLIAPPVAALAVYVAANLATGLPPLPVSGATKSGMFLRLNLGVLLHVLASPFGDGLGTKAPSGWHVRSELVGAVLTGCVLSLSLGAAALVRSRREPTDARGRAAIYVPIVLLFLCRLSYYLAFIRLWAQGFWYYVDIAVALTAIILLQIDVSRLRGRAWTFAMAAAWLAMYVPAANRLVDFSLRNEWCPQLISRQARQISRCLDARRPRAKLLDSSDAIFAYFLDSTAQPASGLTATAANYRVLATRGIGPYQKQLIAQGYTINVFSPLCDSGRIWPKLIAEHIDCGQNPALHIDRVALPPPPGRRR